VIEVSRTSQGALNAGLRFDEWEVHKETLADCLPEETWSLASGSYAKLSVTRAFLQMRLDANENDLDDEDIEVVEATRSKSRAAREALSQARPLFD
jgi:hypothetical protein